MRIILLIMIGFSSLVFADFTKNGDIVTDNKTGLQWQDNADASTTTKIWTDAINYCENLTLDGYSDWRLPNINELKSIVDRSKSNSAIVDGFANFSSSFYWSSTSFVGYEDSAWYVNFNRGYVNYDPKYYNYYVRCVRAGQ